MQTVKLPTATAHCNIFIVAVHQHKDPQNFLTQLKGIVKFATFIQKCETTGNIHTAAEYHFQSCFRVINTRQAHGDS